MGCGVKTLTLTQRAWCSVPIRTHDVWQSRLDEWARCAGKLQRIGDVAELCGHVAIGHAALPSSVRCGAPADAVEREMITSDAPLLVVSQQVDEDGADAAEAAWPPRTLNHPLHRQWTYQLVGVTRFNMGKLHYVSYVCVDVDADQWVSYDDGDGGVMIAADRNQPLPYKPNAAFYVLVSGLNN